MNVKPRPKQRPDPVLTTLRGNTMTTIRRFQSPGVLTDDSLVLGISIKRWNQAFTGSFEESLKEVKLRVNQIDSTKQLPPHSK